MRLIAAAFAAPGVVRRRCRRWERARSSKALLSSDASPAGHQHQAEEAGATSMCLHVLKSNIQSPLPKVVCMTSSPVSANTPQGTLAQAPPMPAHAALPADLPLAGRNFLTNNLRSWRGYAPSRPMRRLCYRPRCTAMMMAPTTSRAVLMPTGRPAGLRCVPADRAALGGGCLWCHRAPTG